ncbi:MAG: hypothetical protein JST58_17385 [Bacteroidetes bacterium]|nr:hypothetical protein [Bacteroidota bacterium]
MTLKIFLPFLATAFISCSQKPTISDKIFIIPKRHKSQIDTKPNEPPPPPPIQTYYLPANFIIDTAGQVYFYQQQQYGWFCGTGIEWDTPPEFIDLKPKDLIRVPLNDITDFVKINIINLDSNDRRVSIASIKDTIKSEGLIKLFKIFNDTSNKIRWTFRKATQEESIVLKYKELNWKYYSDNIKWDSSKIRFPPTIDKMLKYTPPKVEDE